MTEEIQKILADHEKRISALEKGMSQTPKPKATRPAKKSIGDLLLDLKAEGFFKEEKTLAQISDSLRLKGWNLKRTSLPKALLKMLREGNLKRKQVTIDKKKTFLYYA